MPLSRTFISTPFCSAFAVTTILPPFFVYLTEFEITFISACWSFSLSAVTGGIFGSQSKTSVCPCAAASPAMISCMRERNSSAVKVSIFH